MMKGKELVGLPFEEFAKDELFFLMLLLLLEEEQSVAVGVS